MIKFLGYFLLLKKLFSWVIFSFFHLFHNKQNRYKRLKHGILTPVRFLKWEYVKNLLFSKCKRLQIQTAGIIISA